MLAKLQALWTTIKRWDLALSSVCSCIQIQVDPSISTTWSFLVAGLAFGPGFGLLPSLSGHWDINAPPPAPRDFGFVFSLLWFRFYINIGLHPKMVPIPEGSKAPIPEPLPQSEAEPQKAA